VREQLLAGEHLAGVAQEHLEHRELAGAELDGPVVDRRAARAQVERDVAGAQHRLLRGALAAQAHPDPREELLEAERLGDVVVGAVVQARDLVGDLVAGGQDHDRHPLALGAHRAQDRHAVQPGQAQVEDEQVEVVVAREGEGGGAVRRRRGDEAVGAQALLQEGGEPRLVLGDQDAVHGASGSSDRTDPRRTARRRAGRSWGVRGAARCCCWTRGADGGDGDGAGGAEHPSSCSSSSCWRPMPWR
jgi:hypothetical protein